jgi:calpain-15
MFSRNGEEIAIFKDGANYTDIYQGGLGTCYFMATLSSIAETPSRIENLFLTQEVNDCGIYLMIFYINGVQTPVLVDDWFPSENNRPAFARPNEGEIWPMLVEKAWAKCHGSFKRVWGGQSCRVFEWCLGTPTCYLVHNNKRAGNLIFDDDDSIWQ